MQSPSMEVGTANQINFLPFFTDRMATMDQRIQTVTEMLNHAETQTALARHSTFLQALTAARAQAQLFSTY